MENDEWQERRTEPVNERDTMKNSRKTNVKSNPSDIEAKERAAGTGKNSCSQISHRVDPFCPGRAETAAKARTDFHETPVSDSKETQSDLYGIRCGKTDRRRGRQRSHGGMAEL